MGKKEEPIVDIMDSVLDDGYKDKSGAGRVILVVVSLLLTLLVAVAAGAWLALMDMEKTPADFVAAVQGNDVEIAVNRAREEYEAIFAAASEKVTADIEEAQKAEEEEEAAGEALGEISEDNTELVSSEVAGISTVVSAGTNDVIVYKPTSEAAAAAAASPSVIKDPNAGYPLPFSAVDYSYFDDALFIGDSRMQGFGMYSGLNNATFFAITSFTLYKYETMPVVQTPNGKVPIFQALPYDSFTKIYIKVGLNELGGSDEKFLATYAEFIAKLREMEPRAIIYVHGVLPVTAQKSSTDSTHSNPKIAARNESLKQFAEENKCYYIDINSVVSLEDGSLMPEMAGDGVHLKASYMNLWKEYLRTHAVIF